MIGVMCAGSQGLRHVSLPIVIAYLCLSRMALSSRLSRGKFFIFYRAIVWSPDVSVFRVQLLNIVFSHMLADPAAVNALQKHCKSVCDSALDGPGCEVNCCRQLMQTLAANQALIML